MSPARADFDPYTLLEALERNRVNYVVIGGFARVIHGSPETTSGLDITPQPRSDNLRRLNRALTQLDARDTDREPFTLNDKLPDQPVIELTTSAGELKIVREPAGTRNGYDDLRRQATRENIGHGLKPRFASLPDLARTLTALQRGGTERTLQQLNRLIELDRGRAITR